MTSRYLNVAIVNLAVTKVRDESAGFARKARRVIALRVGQIPEECIAALELNAVRQPLGHSSRQSVIVAAAAIGLDLNQPKVRVHQQWTSGRISGRVGCKLIGVPLAPKVTAMAAVVRQAQRRTESDIAFDREVTLIDLRILVMNISRLLEELRPKLGELRRERIRKLQRRFAIDDRLVVERLVRTVDCVSRTQQRAQGSLNEPSEAASNYRLSIRRWPPCETGARRKIVLLRITQALGNSSLPRCENGRIADGSGEVRIQNREGLVVRYNNCSIDAFSIDDGTVVQEEVRRVQKAIPEHRVVFPTEAVIQGQMRSDFPIVLNIKREGVRDTVAIRLNHRIQLRLVRYTQQESCIRIADERTCYGVVKGVDTESLWRIHIVAKTGHVAEIAAELHTMSAAAPREVVEHLKCTVAPEPRRVSTGLLKTRDHEIRNGVTRRIRRQPR